MINLAITKFSIHNINASTVVRTCTSTLLKWGAWHNASWKYGQLFSALLTSDDCYCHRDNNSFDDFQPVLFDWTSLKKRFNNKEIEIVYRSIIILLCQLSWHQAFRLGCCCKIYINSVGLLWFFTERSIPQKLPVIWYYTHTHTHFQMHTIQLNVHSARGSLLFIEDRCVYVYIVMLSIICNACMVLIITFIIIVLFLLA